MGHYNRAVSRSLTRFVERAAPAAGTLLYVTVHFVLKARAQEVPSSKEEIAMKPTMISPCLPSEADNHHIPPPTNTVDYKPGGWSHGEGYWGNTQQGIG